MEELSRLAADRDRGGTGTAAYLLEKVAEELEQRHVRLGPLRHRDSPVSAARNLGFVGGIRALLLPLPIPPPLGRSARWCRRAPVGDFAGAGSAGSCWSGGTP
jgi:hypothetical protein